MKNKHRYQEIDLLRGIACLAVVAFHFFSHGPHVGWITGMSFPVVGAVASYGYLGVHLFFMISGFVILLSADGSTPRNFLASRVARLYPAFWVAATLTAGTVWLAGDIRFIVSWPDYFINLTMFAHWFDVPYVDGVYWSLAVELHFYLYVLIALYFGLLGRIEWLLTAWLVVSAINMFRPMWPVEFWLDAKWAPFFVAGGTVFVIRTRGISTKRLALLATAYGLAILYPILDAQEITMNTVIVATIITVFFMVFILIAFKRWSISNSHIATWFGILTYPVYLLHQNLGCVFYEYLYRICGNAVLGLLLTLTTVIGLAWIVNRFVETTMGPKLKRIINNQNLRS